MPLLIEQLIHNNRYRIDALLGQGGMGAVYRAWDMSLNIPVAIKENLDASLEAQKQFSHEAQILARLSHPNLPRVTDYFFIPGQGQYLVMDFVEGEDLQAMVDRLGVVPEPQILNWISQVCDALAYLHNQPSPIIHRDIKPANIKVRPDGRAILVDFGIAKVYDPHLATTIGAKAVTPGYSPPEQYGGGATDARSDIYALGATLYHLLTGQQPPESVQRMVSNTLLPLPHQLNQHISPPTEQVILKAIEVSTDRRYQSIDELQAALPQSVQHKGAQPPHKSTGTVKQTEWEASKTAQEKPSHKESIAQEKRGFLQNISNKHLWIIISILAISLLLGGGRVLLGMVDSERGFTPLFHYSSTATFTPESTRTLKPTRTATPAPIKTSTASATHTSQPTASPTDTPIPSAVSPTLITPELGTTCQSPFIFQWNGQLYGNQMYVVRAINTRTGYQINSSPTASTIWTVEVPGETYGEWKWRVYVTNNTLTVAQSSEGYFWFDPFPTNLNSAEHTTEEPQNE